MKKKVSVIDLIHLYQETDREELKNKIFNRIYKKFAHFINTKAKDFEKEFRISRDEVRVELMYTLYRCVNYFDFSSASFTTYFKNSVCFNLRQEFRKEFKYMKHEVVMSGDFFDNCEYEDSIVTINSNDRPDEMSIYEANKILKNINKKQHKDILVQRYVKELTFEQIAENENITKQAVQQLHNRAIEKIRNKFKGETR